MNSKTLGSGIALMFVLALAGCKPAPEPTLAPVAADLNIEALYTAGRHGEVVLQATAIIQSEVEDREAVAHARFFRAMSWLAQDRRVEQARGLLELRELELDYDDLVWGPIAGAYGAKILRAELLQEALLELTLELRELEQHARLLEQSLDEAHTTLAARDTKLAAVEQERDTLREQIEQTKAQIKLGARRILELEEELAALKQVDMQREP